VQGAAGFGLTNSVDDVAMTGAVALMVLVGAAVGWRRLCTTGSVGRCVGDAVDAVVCRVPASGRGWPECAQGKTAAVLWLPFSYTVRDEMEKKQDKRKKTWREDVCARRGDSGSVVASLSCCSCLVGDEIERKRKRR
jgi:hypothetical protein